MGISGGQSGCKVLFPWVAWLSLGLRPAGRDEVRGVSSKSFPGSPGVGFGWFLAWPLHGTLRMGGAAHPCVMSNSAWVTWGGSRADPTLLLLLGSLEAQGEVTNTCVPRARKWSPRALETASHISLELRDEQLVAAATSGRQRQMKRRSESFLGCFLDPDHKATLPEPAAGPDVWPH